MDDVTLDMSLKRNFRQQLETLFREEILFAPASLEITADEWRNIVYTDVELAAQIGCTLIERNKDLNMIITSADACAEEQSLRIQYYERQINSLKESFENQTRLYEKFEKQVEELTTNYEKIQNECKHYKKKNKKLWKSIESLENTCDKYLEEINRLKSIQPLNYNNLPNSYSTESSNEYIEHQQSSSFEAIDKNSVEYSDLISLRAYSEELSRKFDVERNQRNNLEKKYEKIKHENEDLHSQIQWLEYKLVRHEPNSLVKPLSSMSKSKSLFDVSLAVNDENVQNSDHDNDHHQNINQGSLTVPSIAQTIDFERGLLNEQHLTSSPLKDTTNCSDYVCSKCRETKLMSSLPDRNLSVKNAGNIRKCSSLSNYQELFEEIFEKLKTTRDT